MDPLRGADGGRDPDRLLDELITAISESTRATLMEAVERGGLRALGTPRGQGHADVTFGLDLAVERAIGTWLETAAGSGPLSLFTEDTGWRHRGPDPAGAVHALESFDHGGPRLILDPIDGTRNLMFDLRPAWALAAAAPPGTGEPRLSEVRWARACELPDSRAARYRLLSATRGAGCVHELRELDGDGLVHRERLDASSDEDRVDQGYFPFFAFHPDVRSEVDALAQRVFARLAEHEGAELEHCYDDQYISSGGQLALLALGTYRMCADVRPKVAAQRGRTTQTAKPYDVAASVLCAREAGCVVHDLDGQDLDCPLDGHTEVGFVAYRNAATAARIAPHVAAVLGS